MVFNIRNPKGLADQLKTVWAEDVKIQLLVYEKLNLKVLREMITFSCWFKEYNPQGYTFIEQNVRLERKKKKLTNVGETSSRKNKLNNFKE